MPAKLTDEEIRKRLIRLRNLERLHTHDREQIASLKQRVHTLEQEKADDRAYFEALIQKQAIQIAELQTMVFGKKRRPPMGGTPIASDEQILPVVPVPRTKESYRRPVPPASAITSEVAVPLPATCTCGGSFGGVTVHSRYEEDIPLPELTPGYQAHLVTKYLVERGVCLACGKTTASKGLGGAEVALGPNVRLLACHLIAVVGMSYTQVTELLLSLYGLTVSKAELVNMLRTQHIVWTPSYNQLKADIRAAPVVHIDETPWTIQQEKGGYAWVLCDANSPRVCFELVASRGAPHAKRLFGQGTANPFAGIRVSDDYGPYRNPELPGSQQLCWAHLYRTIRDLRYNANLLEKQLPYVTQWYAGFAGTYQSLRGYLAQPYDKAVREQQAVELWKNIQVLVDQQPPDKTSEPDKLTRLKAQLQRAGQSKLFTCLTHDTPCDNNRAERDLRQLVLKRKRSFGSQTEKGAKALATILSLCATTWRMYPNGYFKQLALLG